MQLALARCFRCCLHLGFDGAPYASVLELHIVTTRQNQVLKNNLDLWMEHCRRAMKAAVLSLCCLHLGIDGAPYADDLELHAFQQIQF